MANPKMTQRCPDTDPVVVPLPVGGKIVRFDRLGGSLREYSWASKMAQLFAGRPSGPRIRGQAARSRLPG